LLDVQFELGNDTFDLNVVFIGEGEGKEALQKKANELGLNNKVWFYGPCYKEEEIGNLVYNADVCISPGNVGLTAMHTMVYGTPVITHNDFSKQMPEFEAVEKGITGDFFKSGDLQDILVVVKNWFNEGYNRNVIRENCYDKIDKYYNPKYQLKIIKEVLNEN
jgi:glycosyltransferase involved in cell wall biosynthesis